MNDRFGCLLFLILIYGLCIAVSLSQRRADEVRLQAASKWSVVTRSVEVLKETQTTYEVDIDQNGDGVADMRAVFNRDLLLSKGQRLFLPSLLKNKALMHIVMLQNQR